MKIKSLAFVYFLPIILGLACSGTAAPVTSQPADSSATHSTVSSDTADGNIFNTSQTNYIHPSGAFQLPSLEGWKVEESENGVVFTSTSGPEEEIQVKITVANTGAELTPAAFEYFVGALEINNYASKDKYQLLNYLPDPQKRTITYDKTYAVGDKYYYALSIHYMKGQIIYTAELIAHSQDWMRYSKAFPQLAESIQLNEAKAAELPSYQTTKVYSAPNDIFSIEVPAAWYYNRSEPNADTIIDSFTSPDGFAAIQIVSFNNGYTWNQKWAGDVALNLLQNYLTQGAGDIKITADVPLDNGKRERLDWLARKGGYSGSTYFETHERQLILFSLTVGDTQAELYKPILEEIANSYKLKEETAP